MQRGGEIKFILEGIIDRAKDSSWAYGDADYDDCHVDDDEKLPKMPHFDDNFEFLETYVLDQSLGIYTKLLYSLYSKF